MQHPGSHHLHDPSQVPSLVPVPSLIPALDPRHAHSPSPNLVQCLSLAQTQGLL